MGTATSGSEDLRAVAVECYRAAVRNVAFYAVELDKKVTAGYRESLSQLEARAEMADGEALPALLRDYRGRALAYVNGLCGQITESAGALRRILDSLAEGDGDYEGRMRGALARLRTLARSDDVADLRDPLLAAGFLKRLHRILPPESAIGRWSDEEFMVLLPLSEEPAAETEKRIESQLSGSYACSRDGKAVRPSLQVRATMLSAAQA